MQKPKLALSGLQYPKEVRSQQETKDTGGKQSDKAVDGEEDVNEKQMEITIKERGNIML